MVAFANTPGRIGRSDAENPFAEVLASFLTNNALTSADLGRQLKQDVFERTRGSQLPWIRSDLGAVQLAALPEVPTAAPLQTPAAPSFDRSALVRAVQAELRRHQCYTGALNGDIKQADSGLEDLAETATGKKAPEIELASAKPEEFENWLTGAASSAIPSANAIPRQSSGGLRCRPFRATGQHLVSASSSGRAASVRRSRGAVTRMSATPA